MAMPGRLASPLRRSLAFRAAGSTFLPDQADQLGITMPKCWALQDAKVRFSEVVRRPTRTVHRS